MAEGYGVDSVNATAGSEVVEAGGSGSGGNIRKNGVKVGKVVARVGVGVVVDFGVSVCVGVGGVVVPVVVVARVV